MKTVYLLQYDNELQYEDHWRAPLFIVATKKGAESIANEFNGWIKDAIDNAPEPINWREIPDEEYEAKNAKIREYYNNLNPPYGCKTVTSEIEWGKCGKVIFEEIEFKIKKNED